LEHIFDNSYNRQPPQNEVVGLLKHRLHTIQDSFFPHKKDQECLERLFLLFELSKPLPGSCSKGATRVLFNNLPV
jgi:hypothetical protein